MDACAYFCILEIEELPMTILSHSNLCNLSNFPAEFRFVPMLNSGCFLGELIGNLRMFQLKPFYNSLYDENQALFATKEIQGTCAPMRVWFFCLGGCMGQDPNL